MAMNDCFAPVSRNDINDDWCKTRLLAYTSALQGHYSPSRSTAGGTAIWVNSNLTTGSTLLS